MSKSELEKIFYEMRELNPRKAAEVAYVLARLYLEADDLEKARLFGHESLWLFDRCRMETLEDCAAQHVTLAGVALPSIIHQDVVRERLKPLNL